MKAPMSLSRRPRSLILLVSVAACIDMPRAQAEDAASVRDITPCATAHYSFGTAVDTDGLVLFTEFSHRRIRSWNPRTSRTEVWRDKNAPGMYGLATGTAGDVFVGMDLGDTGSPGKVLRICADGHEEFVLENITRPRQLTCDSVGNLFVVLEGGKVLKWDKVGRNVTEIMTATSPLSGIAVGADGSIYISEYGVFDVAPEGYSQPLTPGRVKVRRPNGEIATLAEGFWRARGLALYEGTLYLCTESNREDQGNAGQLISICTKTGSKKVLIDSLDYPQFPSVGRGGKIYFTLGRDNVLAVCDPDASFQKFSIDTDTMTNFSVRGGTIVWKAIPGGIPFFIRVQSLLLTGSFIPDVGVKLVDGWIELPADQFQLNPADLHPKHDAEHPAPGIFELPRIETGCDSGRLNVDVFPLRRRYGCRWPMKKVGTADESPAPGFSEQPSSFRCYFSWSATPPE